MSDDSFAQARYGTELHEAMERVISSERLLKCAVDAANVAEAKAHDDPRMARAWADISAAWSMAARVALETELSTPIDVVMTVDEAKAIKARYQGKSNHETIRADYINPHQRIGVLSDDEIETVMALRRGTAVVTPRGRSEVIHPYMHDGERAVYGRVVWCLMRARGNPQQITISPEGWAESENGNVSIKLNEDGSRVITRVDG